MLAFACQPPSPQAGSELSTFVQGRYAYVPARTGVQVVDINTPERPRILGGLNTAGQVVRTQVRDDYLYALKIEGWNSATGEQTPSGVVIASLNDPIRPKEVAFLPSTYGVYEFLATDSYLFVSDWAETRVYDIRDPAEAVLSTILPTKIDNIVSVEGAIYGGWAQCAFRSGLCMGGVHQIDLDKGAPTITKTYEYEQFGVSQLFPYGRYLYLIGNGFAAVPLDQLDQGTNYLQTPSDIYGQVVAFSGNFFLTNSGHQLLTINLNDPAHPTLSHTMEIAPEGTFFLESSQQDSHLYLVSDYGFHIFNMANPNNPYGVGYVALE